jgi:hypothetical protein
MTRRTPSSTIAAWQAARDREQAAKVTAAQALADAAASHSGRKWTALSPPHGIAAEDANGYRVGWTNLDTVPKINASVRIGETFLSVRGPDVATTLDALELAMQRVGP